MKKIMLILLLVLGGYAVNAQVHNSSPRSMGCPVTVTGFCYDAMLCVRTITCGSVYVPLNTTMPLPACGCPLGMSQGYELSFDVHCPGGVALEIGDPAAPCALFPPSGILSSPCSQCEASPVFYAGPTLMINQPR